MPRGSPGVVNPRKANKPSANHPWNYKKTRDKFYAARNKHKFEENIDMGKDK